MKCSSCNLLFINETCIHLSLLGQQTNPENFHTLPVVLGLVIRECSIRLMAIGKLDFLSRWLCPYTSLQPVG